MHLYTITYRLDGQEYYGGYSMSQKQGKGRQLWPDGARYEGDWKNGKCHGFGWFIWYLLYIYIIARPSGDRYFGEFVNGKKEGYGRQTWYAFMFNT